MTTPAAPAVPAAPAAPPVIAPPATDPGAPQQQDGQDHEGDDDGQDHADDRKELRASLAAERKKTQALERQLAEANRKSMSDVEKAIAEAHDKGRNEARGEMAARVVAAEFRNLATGRLPDAEAALEMLDLTRFVKEDGEPDREALSAAVDRLAPAQSAPPARVPGGPHSNHGQAPETDFIRSLRGGGRR